MAITRAQIPKQLEPGLGRGWGKWERAKFKKIVESLDLKLTLLYLNHLTIIWKKVFLKKLLLVK